ncbi:hypothetical protein EBZ80_26125 [bacterium]|nr:hypothetical protein [bacterium]
MEILGLLLLKLLVVLFLGNQFLYQVQVNTKLLVLIMVKFIRQLILVILGIIPIMLELVLGFQHVYQVLDNTKLLFLQLAQVLVFILQIYLWVSQVHRDSKDLKV